MASVEIIYYREIVGYDRETPIFEEPAVGHASLDLAAGEAVETAPIPSSAQYALVTSLLPTRALLRLNGNARSVGDRDRFHAATGATDHFIMRVRPGAVLAFKGVDSLGGGVISESGWAFYRDDTDTEESPQALLADDPAELIIRGDTAITSQAPADRPVLYDPEYNVVPGVDGDALSLGVGFIAKPTQSGTTVVDTWIDIGGDVGIVFRDQRVLERGQNVGQYAAVKFTVFQGATWETNGGSLFIQTSRNADVYAKELVVARMHKAV